MSQFGFMPSPNSEDGGGRRVGQEMQVIALTSQKGGSGKTTLAGHLAVEAVRAGDGPVAVVDTDPQGSLRGWGRARADTDPAVFAAAADELPDVLVRLRNEGYKLVFVDTPPAVTSAIAEVVGQSDLVVIPTRPSPHDLRAVGATVDIVEARGRAMVFVVNSATPRARITSEAAIALSQHGTVAPITLHHRVDYAASMIDGRTVMEVNEKSRSAKEVVELWAYLANRLERLQEEVRERVEEQPKASFPAHGPADVHRRAAPTFGRRTGGTFGQ